jgi:hypothetical protein
VTSVASTDLQGTGPGTGSFSHASPTLTSASAVRRLRAPLLIGAVAIGAAATVFALRRSDPPISATPTTTATATATATSGAAQDTAAPTTSTIEEHLSAKPDQAKLFLDDTALPSNPFSGRFRRDEKPHVLRVEADGHTTTQHPLSFASDQTLEVALERAEASKDKPVGPLPDSVPRPPPKPTKKALDGDDPWR